MDTMHVWDEIEERNNIPLLFAQAKTKYQRPDAIDMQMLEYIQHFDGNDLWLMYKVFRQNGDGAYIDTKHIKSLRFPTGWADKAKTAPLFEWNLFLTREPISHGKRSTRYRLLPAGKILFDRMDHNPELIDEQKLHDLTLFFVQENERITKAIWKQGEVRMLCFSEEAIDKFNKISKVLHFQMDLQEKYGRTKEQADAVIRQYPDITDIDQAIATISQEYMQYGDLSAWEKPTSQYLYSVLMSAQKIPNT